MRVLHLSRWLKLCLTLTFCLFSQKAYSEHTLYLGVFQNYSNKSEVEQRFSLLAQHLSDVLPGHKIAMKVLDSEELTESFRNHQVDMLITDPYHYQLLRTGVADQSMYQAKLNGKTKFSTLI